MLDSPKLALKDEEEMEDFPDYEDEEQSEPDSKLDNYEDAEDDEDDDDEEEGVTTVLDTPPRPNILAIRSPEAPPPLSRAPSPPELMTVSRSFPEGHFVPPASTAPPRLADDEGRPKRKRAPTQGRYKDVVAQGKVSKP